MKKTIKSTKQTCSICGKEYSGFGNNAYPINQGRCCDCCNMLVVIPERVKMMYASMQKGA